MIMLPILTKSLIHFSKKVGRMYFLNLEVKGLNEIITCYYLLLIFKAANPAVKFLLNLYS